jgi:hypothetical protein
MTIRLALGAALTVLALSGCAYPTSSIEQDTPPGHLKIVDAPPGARLVVDGRVIGERTGAKADTYAVSTGPHTIEETMDGRVILHREYMVGAGSTIEIKGAP